MQNDKLEKLKEQRKVLDARIRKEQNRESTRQRKRDTRRKILAGAAVLDQAGKNPAYKANLYRLLDRFLIRKTDRELFGLPVKEEGQTDEGAVSAPVANEGATA